MIVPIAPRAWRLEPAAPDAQCAELAPAGLDVSDIEERCRRNVYDWLSRQYIEEHGAFAGFYDARTREFAPPQTANLIAPWQLVAAHDRYGGDEFLQRARSCLDWLHINMVDDHPMSLVLGGVVDNLKTNQVWTKYTADYVMSNLALYERTGDEELLQRAVQSGRFLIQSASHGFRPKYDLWQERWLDQGWQSFGRVALALWSLGRITGDDAWLERAVKWCQFGQSLAADDGCFYLVHEQYYSSDVAADEMRALLQLHLDTGHAGLLEACVRFADWHVRQQRHDGCWCVTVDRSGVPVGNYVGPGDVPNLAVALLLVHRHTDNLDYAVSACRAVRYALTTQAVPGTGQPYEEDENTHWGFWSWQPHYDYTMSVDQSTHHVRGLWAVIDYLTALPPTALRAIAERCGELDAASDAPAAPVERGGA